MYVTSDTNKLFFSLVSHSTQTTGTLRPSSLLGGGVNTKRHLKGYIASDEAYSRHFNEIVSHVPKKKKCIVHQLVWSDNLTKSFYQAVDWLDLCGHHGIILNPDKFVFGADTIEFAGFEITPHNVRPRKKYLDAIHDFPTPTTVTDV